MKWAALLWLIVNVALYLKNGIKVVADSERYLEYANGLLNGFYFDSHNFWYIGYSLYIALLRDVTAVVAGQYVLSFTALVALYQAARLLWDSERSALITSALFLLFIDISQWNSYVLTESIYTSFICFSLYGLVLIYKGERRWFMITLVALLIVFTSFIKPTGIAIVVALLVVLVRRNIALSILTFIVFALLVNRMLTTYLVIENYQYGEIIYGVTANPNLKNIEGLALTPPAELYVPPASYPPAIRIIAFIIHHPLYWGNLFFHKVFYLLSHTRPFWSVGHNVFSAAILLLSYAAFIVGIRSTIVGRDVVIFAITFLLIHILSVGITSDDWDGRFLIPMLPVIFIFSGNGLATWRYRKSSQ